MKEEEAKTDAQKKWNENQNIDSMRRYINISHCCFIQFQAFRSCRVDEMKTTVTVDEVIII